MYTLHYYRLLVPALLLIGAISAAPALSHAQTSKQGNEPALIKADTLTYDKEKDTITASGHVEVTQAKRILLADEIVYNQGTDTVHAKGNVSMLEPSGDVFFADEVTLSDEMKKGVVENIYARLADNSLLAAKQGRRMDEYVYKFDQAVYTPCTICKENNLPPVWQLKAKKVKVDEKEQRITYRHGTLEAYGVPVFYTPFFSHPTPGADRKTGFLTPSYGGSGTLGPTVSVPYYLNIAPNMDATVTPIYTGREGLIASGQFRHLTQSGYYELFGSATHPDRFNDQGQRIPGKEFRGHIEGVGNFALNDQWDWGFAGKRATDDTYLRRYRFGDEDDLTTRVYAQRLEDRDYTVAQALSFQGLLATDNPDRTPLALPYVHSHIERDAGFNGSRWVMDADGLVISRNEGAESRRVSLTGGWKLPYIIPSGHVFTVMTTLRGDTYSVDEVTDLVNPAGSDLDGVESRIIPQAEVDWRYPLVNQLSRASVFLEPTANLIVSPYGGNPDIIPNEDSQDFELSHDNLFSPNRFTGLDRVENGPRVNYGLRAGAQGTSGGNVSALFGQTYRVKEDNNLSAGTGLDDNFSDYVGRVAISGQHLDLAYRFRLDKDDFLAHRNEISTGLNFSRLNFNLDYISLDETNIANTVGQREEIFVSSGVILTDVWSVNASARRDLTGDGGFIYTSANLLYAGDCVDFMFSLFREFTRDRDIEPATSFTFQVSLKNLTD